MFHSFNTNLFIIYGIISLSGKARPNVNIQVKNSTVGIQIFFLPAPLIENCKSKIRRSTASVVDLLLHRFEDWGFRSQIPAWAFPLPWRSRRERLWETIRFFLSFTVFRQGVCLFLPILDLWCFVGLCCSSGWLAFFILSHSTSDRWKTVLFCCWPLIFINSY